MIFLIDYDCKVGKLVTMKTFDDASLKQAYDERLNLELEQRHQGIMREVVLLDAANEEAIRRTHGRYFKSAQELVDEFFDSIR
ncbi:MAG TPA: hypothetical protein VGG19_09010 [Tepidisphaeraceae bacterium]|jgi:hypothetical protein